jgi:hypothetical protein
MQISEAERTQLILKKEEIRSVTQELLEISTKETFSRQDITDIKKKIAHTLSLLHIISSYSTPNRDLHNLMMLAVEIDGFLITVPEATRFRIDIFCMVANSVTFSYSRWPALFKASIPKYGSFEVHK